MKEIKYLLICCWFSLLLGVTYSFKEKQLYGCNEKYVVKGDTLKFNFYNPEDKIKVEWRKCPQK